MKGIKYSEALKEDLEDFRGYETDEKKAKLGERIFFKTVERRSSSKYPARESAGGIFLYSPLSPRMRPAPLSSPRMRGEGGAFLEEVELALKKALKKYWDHPRIGTGLSWYPGMRYTSN